MDWADRIAICQHRRLPRFVQLDDVKQAAYMGLIKATRSFDPDRGASFKTFARYRIVGAIADDLRLSDWGTRGARRDGMVTHHSFFSEVRPNAVFDNDREWYDVEDLAINVSEDVMVDLDNKAEVAAHLRGLSSRDRAIMVMYYMRSMTMLEIGREVGLSEARVSQLISQWVKEIRHSGRRVA